MTVDGTAGIVAMAEDKPPSLERLLDQDLATILEQRTTEPVGHISIQASSVETADDP